MSVQQGSLSVPEAQGDSSNLQEHSWNPQGHLGTLMIVPEVSMIVPEVFISVQYISASECLSVSLSVCIIIDVGLTCNLRGSHSPSA